MLSITHGSHEKYTNFLKDSVSNFGSHNIAFEIKTKLIG